ncbi:MAG TPA: histidine phosphatase family protein [Chloroflexota bacterium]|nr:histidine phosphatase family protein [Chloroflexota bacterium]
MSYQADRPFTLYFVRHGVTEPNFRGFRCGGDLDIPLMDIGCDQAYLLAKQIEKMNLKIGVIVAGSLIRTRQTASIISGVLGNVPVEVEPLVNERRLGQWNNRPISETEEMLAARVTPPGGESEDEFTQRISLALEHLRPYLDRRPLLVSSKGVGRVMNGLLGGSGRMQVGNGEIVEFSVQKHHGQSHLKVVRPHAA